MLSLPVAIRCASVRLRYIFVFVSEFELDVERLSGKVLLSLLTNVLRQGPSRYIV